MAIVTCPKCGKMVSDTNKRCPECDSDLVITKYACASCGSTNIMLDEKGYKHDAGLSYLFFGLIGVFIRNRVNKKKYAKEVASGGGYYVCKDCGANFKITPDEKKE